MDIVFAEIEKCKGCGKALQVGFSNLMYQLPHLYRYVKLGEAEQIPANPLCRGQGTWYSGNAPTDLDKFPPREAHIPFTGIFEGHCCACAYKQGWHADSMRKFGCNNCKKLTI